MGKIFHPVLFIEIYGNDFPVDHFFAEKSDAFMAGADVVPSSVIKGADGGR